MQKLTFSLLFALLYTGNGTCAPLQPNEVHIQITGRAVIPPCYINNGADIDINFGVVGIAAANGGNSFVERWIPVMCEDTEAAYSIKIWGVGAASNSHILATDVAGVGISFSQAQNELPLNTLFKPSTPNGLMLVSRLVISEDFVNGTEGAFSASATLTTQYD